MVMGGRASSKEGRGRVVAYVVDCSRPTPSYPLLALAARKGEARNGPTPTHQMRQVASSQPAVPAVLRVGSRGACDSQISDVSSLELYGVFSVNVEPLTTINTLKLLIRESTG